jgi:ribosomal protection tetracycline resistance protein
MTGAGVDHLLAELSRLLPGQVERPGEPLSAIVFKVQRSPVGEKIALARVFSGTLAVRDHVTVRRALPSGAWEELSARVTGLEHYRGGTPSAVNEVGAGDIGRVHGLREVLVGDVIGAVPAQRRQPRFPRPTLESVIRPRVATDAGRMYAALQQLEEQDPLISIRRGTREPTVSVRLYGEVQKEVIQTTLHEEFGVRVEFDASQTICIERVMGTGSAFEAIGEPQNPFPATVGLRIEPGETGCGPRYHRELGALPLAFYRAIEETVFATLEEGLLGWPVLDWTVKLTEVGMTPITAAGDFRKLTPLVLMAALREAGTQVCEPIERFTVELPSNDLGEAYVKLVTAGAAIAATEHAGERSCISGLLPAAGVDWFERLLPGLTSGSGVLRSESAGYRPIQGTPPARRRTDFDPLNRKRYLAEVSQV